jgi:hypothetical protein
MEYASQLSAKETLRGTPPATNAVPRANGWLRSALLAVPAPARLVPVAYGFADQALAVGGGFLARKDAVTGIGE